MQKGERKNKLLAYFNTSESTEFIEVNKLLKSIMEKNRKEHKLLLPISYF